MAVQDQSESDTTHPRMISLDVGAPSLRNILPEDKISLADDYAPKIRKQYTITKQRERWSDEEHGKFLEALKLHGRGWRRIEEHVGTKTAVQIRSHAQKFFTKVVRDSNNGDANSVKSVEIPPPRPKRKPMHPYPRKLAIPAKCIPLVPEESKRSVSPESRSPTSVLSVLGSDAFGAVDSCKPSDRSSPDSSAVVENPDDLVVSEPSDRILEEKRSPPPQDYASSNPDNQACVKLELFPEENDFVKEEGSVEASSTLSLKLFGQTVLVADCNIPSNQTSGRTLLTDVKDQPASRTFSPSESECGPSTLTIGSPASSPLLPRGIPYVSAAFPCAQVHNPIPMKGRPLFHYKDSEDDETQKEGSSTGSNGESASGELTGDKPSEVEAESSRELSSVRASVPSFSKRRNNSNFSNRMQGFVPYKRCLAERGISSTLTGEEREEQRTRLCL